MTGEIKVGVELRKVQQQLDIAAKQIPFATALALTKTAKAASEDLTRELPSMFKKTPTPFTTRAMTYTWAKKSDLTATVQVRPLQARYLQKLETGGTETPDGKAFVLPIGAKLNQYGNMPKGYLAKMKGKKRGQAFVGVENGAAGFWMRNAGNKLVLLAAFIRKRTYKPTLGYHKRVAESVQKHLPKAVADAVAQAMRKARP
jgi:hypothetical protein